MNRYGTEKMIHNIFTYTQQWTSDLMKWWIWYSIYIHQWSVSINKKNLMVEKVQIYRSCEIKSLCAEIITIIIMISNNYNTQWPQYTVDFLYSVLFVAKSVDIISGTFYVFATFIHHFQEVLMLDDVTGID